MSTATAPPKEKKITPVHGIWLHGRRYVCIQKDCDGTHHFMCSCAR